MHEVAHSTDSRYSISMTFPDRAYADIGAFADDYFETLAGAVGTVDRAQLGRAAALLKQAYGERRTVYACGNGGSAAISNHLHCDHMKGIQTDTHVRPRIVSLSSTIETITAIANDISYDDVFVYQLRTMADAGDVLITISSSGDSENVVRAAQWAKDNGVRVVALTGFSGGRTAKLADVNLHVVADNYGVIEDAHQSLMHILAQYLRIEAMDVALIKDRKF
ncbi:MAG: SIS domain-containing protein [Proteobacteria bacterium]|nr:SIS domain-containing protein [Pseudomonadota bacterium]